MDGMSTQNPWLFELGDMEDELTSLLDHEFPEMNYFEEIIPEDMAAVLGINDNYSNNKDVITMNKSPKENNHHLDRHQSLSSSTGDSSRPSKQPRSVLNHNSSKPSSLPVILNFGSASSFSDDETRRHLVDEEAEEKQRLLTNTICVRKTDRQITPAKRKSSTGSRDHIMAERRRREKITQYLIALSALVPGLKKMDKSSVLGEAVIYVKQLQERVKALEEENARNKVVESVTLMKKSSQLTTMTSSSEEHDNFSSSGDNITENPPSKINEKESQLSDHIEVRVCKDNLLLKLQCERRQAILVKILTALEKHHLSVTTVHATPFGARTFDVTIIAQMDREIRVHNVVRDLSCAIKGFN